MTYHRHAMSIAPYFNAIMQFHSQRLLKIIAIAKVRTTLTQSLSFAVFVKCRQKRITSVTDKRFTDKQVDVLAALVLAESCLNGPCECLRCFRYLPLAVFVGTKERLLIFRLAFSFGSRLVMLVFDWRELIYPLEFTENMSRGRNGGDRRSVEETGNLSDVFWKVTIADDCLFNVRLTFARLHAACDTTFIYWEQNSFRLYLQDLFLTVRDPHRLHVRSDSSRFDISLSSFSSSLLLFVIVFHRSEPFVTINQRDWSKLIRLKSWRCSIRLNWFEGDKERETFDHLEFCLVFPTRIIQDDRRRSPLFVSRSFGSRWSKCFQSELQRRHTVSRSETDSMLRWIHQYQRFGVLAEQCVQDFLASLRCRGELSGQDLLWLHNCLVDWLEHLFRNA